MYLKNLLNIANVTILNNHLELRGREDGFQQRELDAVRQESMDQLRPRAGNGLCANGGKNPHKSLHLHFVTSLG